MRFCLRSDASVGAPSSEARRQTPRRFANQATLHPNLFRAILGLHLDKRATLVKDVSV